jgi:hypothetical protein
MRSLQKFTPKVTSSFLCTDGNKSCPSTSADIRVVTLLWSKTYGTSPLISNDNDALFKNECAKLSFEHANVCHNECQEIKDRSIF